MLIHDDTYSWEGFGGIFDLASGRCRLRIFDLSREGKTNVMQIAPYKGCFQLQVSGELVLKNLSI